MIDIDKLMLAALIASLLHLKKIVARRFAVQVSDTTMML